MRTSSKRPAAAILALLSLIAACSGSSGKGTPGASTGAARLVAACQGTACADVARVTVTVSKGDGPDFTAIAADLAQNGGQWSGRIDQIPAGPGRRFDAVAFDRAGAQLYTGFGKTDIVAGASAIVSIVLRPPVTPPPVENAVPLIDSLSSSRELVAPGATIQVNVWAHDPNPADALTVRWRSSCGTFDDASKAAPRWTAPGAEGTCPLTVTVSDDHGASVSATITITVTNAVGDVVVDAQFKGWPVIGGLTGNITLGTTMQGDLEVIATDPDGDPLTYAWASTCPGLVFDLQVPYGPTRPHFSLSGPSEACAVSVSVSATAEPGGTTGTLFLPPNKVLGAKCQNVTCLNGQTCDPLDGLCEAAASPCTSVSCLAPAPCHQAGVCDPATGACSYAAQPDGAGCDDGQACTSGDVCAAGVCAGTVSCAAGQTCDASGQCSGGTDPCDGVVCDAPPRCHLLAGASCSQGACTYPSAADATPCVDGLACTVGDACTAGVCAGTVSCAAGQTCDAAGQCAASAVRVMHAVAAKDLAISPLAGVAMDLSGAAYLAGSLFQPTKTFDAISLTSAGGADLFLAKYDPVTHAAVWARSYGDASDQLAAGGAVTADGTVVAIGNFIGNLSIGNTVSNASFNPIDFVVAVDGASGNGKWAKAYDNGLGGVLLAVAANPSLNLVAVCGYTNRASPMVAGATYGGGTNDAVLAVYSSAGTLLWAKQLGGANEEECDSLAIDDNGDVLAAGKYDGAFNPGMGALPNPASSFRRWLWVAKYSGTTGAALAQASFGLGNGINTPKALTVDATGQLLVTGTFTSTLPFGTTSLVTAASSDVFVAKLDPATSFTPAWAVRMGGSAADEGRGIAVSSIGDVLVAGLFNGTTTGAAALTAATSAASDAFALQLDGATGATQLAAAYGDFATQDADYAVINRAGLGAAKDLVGFGGNFTSVIDFGAAGSLATTGQNEAHGYLLFANLLP